MSSRRKLLATVVAVVVCLAMVLGCVGCSSSDEPVSSQTPADSTPSTPTAPSSDSPSDVSYPDVTWDFFVAEPRTHFRYTGIWDLVENVSERTDGHFTINVYAGGETPYTGTEVISICSDNTFQMADAIVANISGSSPVSGIFTFPFLCSSWEDFKTTSEIIYPYFEEEMAAQGNHVLFFFPDPEQIMFGLDDVITTWDDMEGRSTRGQNGYMQEFYSAVGANSIAITGNEISSALSRGVIDSYVTSPFTCLANSHTDYIDWVLDMLYCTAGSFIIVNQEAWDALPAEYQAILEEEGAAMSEYYWNTFIEEKAAEAIDEIASYDIAIYEDTDALIAEGREIASQFYEKWAQDAGGKAVEALAAVNEALGN